MNRDLVQDVIRAALDFYFPVSSSRRPTHVKLAGSARRPSSPRLFAQRSMGGDRPFLVPLLDNDQEMYYIHYEMAQQKARVITVRIDDDLSAGMATVHKKHGTPISEQVRRALRIWLESQGVMKAGRKRAATRKRP